MNTENSKTDFKLIKFSLEFERGYSWKELPEEHYIATEIGIPITYEIEQPINENE